eukprot:CAMPEP_0114548848 /NCGR_PEP_ID=MMETSP0114-20121206/5208_1 /TAXON_ID=31324 /ORGANISM="Goniomonas sp, Strain m" /LENGTH=120 /DNA_ID=CAMNT_0001733481 /DNA_START=60 /DNA_END=422 /DNA_ORIENTATION=+
MARVAATRLGGSSRMFSTDCLPAIKQLIADNRVQIFSKTTCSYCRGAKGIFSNLKVQANITELDQIENGKDMQIALSGFTGQKTVPQVFVAGKFLGGYSETDAALHDGSLEKALAAESKL